MLFIKLGSLMLWDPLARFSKGLTLLLVNSVQTLLSHTSGLSVGHTENIISHHTSIHSTVAWNWFAQSRNLVPHLIDSEECVYGVIVALFVAPPGLIVQICKMFSLSFLRFVKLVSGF